MQYEHYTEGAVECSRSIYSGGGRMQYEHYTEGAVEFSLSTAQAAQRGWQNAV